MASSSIEDEDMPERLVPSLAQTRAKLRTVAIMLGHASPSRRAQAGSSPHSSEGGSARGLRLRHGSSAPEGEEEDGSSARIQLRRNEGGRGGLSRNPSSGSLVALSARRTSLQNSIAILNHRRASFQSSGSSMGSSIRNSLTGTTRIPILPPDTAQELYEILSRVDDLAFPYYMTKEERFAGRRSPSTRQKGTFEKALGEPIERALKYVTEQEFSYYTQISALESAHGWFSRVRDDHEHMEEDLRAEEIMRIAEERQTEEAEDFMEKGARQAAKLRDNLQKQFSAMVRGIVKRTIEKKETKHKLLLERSLAGLKGELAEANATIQGLTNRMLVLRERNREKDARLEEYEWQKDSMQKTASRTEKELRQRVEILEKMLDFKEEKERLLESQERQEGLEAYLEMKRKERGQIEALRSQLRGPMHALMEKNEALRRQVDEKDKAIEELTAQLSMERHSVARKVEAGLQPLKIQVAEYERNIEDLIERLEQMDAVRATLTRVQEENTTMQRTIDLQTTNLADQTRQIDDLSREVKDKDRKAESVRAFLEKKVEQLEISLHNRSTEVESWKEKLGETRRELNDLRGQLEIANRKLAMMAKEAKSQLADERRESHAELLDMDRGFRKQVLDLEQVVAGLRTELLSSKEAVERARAERDKLRKEKEDARRKSSAAAVANAKPLDYSRSRSASNGAGGEPQLVASLEAAVAQDRHVITELKEELHQARVEADERLTRARGENDRLELELRAMQGHYDRACDKIQELQRELDEACNRPVRKLSIAEIVGEPLPEPSGMPPLPASSPPSALSAALEKESLMRDLRDALQRSLALGDELRELRQAHGAIAEKLAARDVEVKGLQEELQAAEQRLRASEKQAAQLSLELTSTKELVALMRQTSGQSQDELRRGFSELLQELQIVRMHRDNYRHELEETAAELEKAKTEGEKAAAKRADEVRGLKTDIFILKGSLKEAKDQLAKVAPAGGATPKAKKGLKRRLSDVGSTPKKKSGGDEPLHSARRASLADVTLNLPAPVAVPPWLSSMLSWPSAAPPKLPRPLLRVKEMEDLVELIFEEGKDVLDALFYGNGERVPEENLGDRTAEGKRLLEEAKANLERAMGLLANLVRELYGEEELDAVLASSVSWWMGGGKDVQGSKKPARKGEPPTPRTGEVVMLSPKGRSTQNSTIISTSPRPSQAQTVKAFTPRSPKTMRLARTEKKQHTPRKKKRRRRKKKAKKAKEEGADEEADHADDEDEEEEEDDDDEDEEDEEEEEGEEDDEEDADGDDEEDEEEDDEDEDNEDDEDDEEDGEEETEDDARSEASHGSHGSKKGKRRKRRAHVKKKLRKTSAVATRTTRRGTTIRHRTSAAGMVATAEVWGNEATRRRTEATTSRIATSKTRRITLGDVMTNTDDKLQSGGGKDSRVVKLEGTITGLEWQIRAKHAQAKTAAEDHRHAVADLTRKLEAVTAEHETLRGTYRSTQERLQQQVAENRRIMEQLEHTGPHTGRKPGKRRAGYDQEEEERVKTRAVELIEDEKSLSSLKLGMRLSLMVMAYRERVFLQELEADKAKRSLSAQEKMALAAGHASLKRDAGRVRQKLALVDRQRAERLDELKQLYSDMARVPKMIVDGKGFASVLDWVKLRRRTCNREEEGRPESPSPAAGDDDRAVWGKEEENLVRNGRGIFFVKAAFPMVPETNDDDDDLPEDQVVEDYIIVRSEPRVDRHSAEAEGGDGVPQLAGVLARRKLSIRGLNAPDDDLLIFSKPSAAAVLQGKGESKLEGAKTAKRRQSSNHSSSNSGSRHVRSSSDLSSVDLLVVQQEALGDDLLSDTEADTKLPPRSPPGIPDQLPPDTAVAMETPAVDPGGFSVPLPAGPEPPPPPLATGAQGSAGLAQGSAGLNGASLGLESGPGLLAPGSEQGDFLLLPNGALSPYLRSPRAELKLPENNAADWLEPGAGLLPPDMEPAHQGLTQSLANAYVDRLGARLDEIDGQGSDGERAARPEPFVPLSERAPVAAQVFDCLTNPAEPLIQLVTDTSMFFPLLARREAQLNQPPQHQHARSRAQPPAARRSPRASASNGPRLGLGHSRSNNSLLPEIVRPPVQPPGGDSIAARAGQLHAVRARQARAGRHPSEPNIRVTSQMREFSLWGGLDLQQQQRQPRPADRGGGEEPGAGGPARQPDQRRQEGDNTGGSSLPPLTGAGGGGARMVRDDKG